MKKNKTFRYLFRPMIALFFKTEIYMAFESMKILNVYLQDKSEEGTSITDPLIYILVNVEDRTFNKLLKTVSDSNFFVGIHLIGKHPCKHAIITFKCLGGKHLKNFFNSQYSKMYNPETLKKHRNKFKVKSEDGTFIFSKEYKVMINDEDYRKEIIAWTGADNPNAVKELASKWKEEEETFDSSTILEKLEI